MRIQLVGKFIGKLTILLGLSMVFPLLWALYYREAASSAFFISIAITIAAGIVFCYFVIRIQRTLCGSVKGLRW